ncbi:DNA topoisomerase IB [Nocardioides alcanivorans]|uniref:DNA topoisomerase IB n=1 Tax=Nocardioides alcanivorans TaxID=2897352 RepID=UPI001F3E1041|nr:DNA topoisomerase IB [Nocardioides alcanivorans]
MVRLRKVSSEGPGWSRRRAGRGFTYVDDQGARLAAADLQRVKDLVIPPAWDQVWICPHANGHLQAVGTDAAGRRQYLYHPAWREKQDAAKFTRVEGFGRALPRIRGRLVGDLAGEAFSREWSCALAVRLLDLGHFRIGGGEFGDDPDSFGLTTLEKRHVHVGGDATVFEFTGKSGVEQSVSVHDDLCAGGVRRLLRRRSGDFEELLGFREGRVWRRLEADGVNDYLRETAGLEVSAKDFRTWHATVLCAVSLADSADARTATARRQAVRSAMDQVAEDLGNTPTIARTSYVDPRVLERFEEGETIRLPRGKDGGAALRDDRRRVERAVLRLLR